MTRNDTDPEMRVTVMRYHDKDSSNTEDSTDHFHVVWSEVRSSSTGVEKELTTPDVKAMTDRLPSMGDEDRLILV